MTNAPQEVYDDMSWPTGGVCEMLFMVFIVVVAVCIIGSAVVCAALASALDKSTLPFAGPYRQVR